MAKTKGAGSSLLIDFIGISVSFVILLLITKNFILTCIICFLASGLFIWLGNAILGLPFLAINRVALNNAKKEFEYAINDFNFYYDYFNNTFKENKKTLKEFFADMERMRDQLKNLEYEVKKDDSDPERIRSISGIIRDYNKELYKMYAVIKEKEEK